MREYFRSIYQNKQGVQVLEMLIAFGLLFMFLSGGMHLFSRHFTTFQAVRNQEKANSILSETIEGLHAIALEDWEVIATNTTYGLTKDGSKWGVTSTTDTLHEGFTRSITVNTFFRDPGNCKESDETSGGVPDSDARIVTLDVSWEERGQTRSVNWEQVLHNWREPFFCLDKTRAEQVNVTLSSSAGWYGWGQNWFLSVDFENTAPHPAVVDKVFLYWSYPEDTKGTPIPSYVSQIYMDGQVVFNSTTSRGTDGVLIDIDNVSIASGQDNISLDAVVFDSNMSEEVLIYTFMFTDGSTSTFGQYTPPST